MEQTDENIGELIKDKIIKCCRYIKSEDIKLSTDIAEYYSGTNRNASSGELADWVFVEVPEVPQIDESSAKDERDLKHMKEDAEKIRSRNKMIEAVCKEAAKQYGAEYIGYNTRNIGYDSTHSNTKYLNIRIK